MTPLFEYVYTIEPLDYNNYLNYAGLALRVTEGDQQRKNYTKKRTQNPSPLQETILNSWLGKQQ